MAKRLDPMLPHLDADWGVIFVFFDGEEAFGEWSATDSLYGARHLAEEWSQEIDGKPSKNSRIHTFLLLDLIGGRDPIFQNEFPQVQQGFDRLITIETRLRKAGLFVTCLHAPKYLTLLIRLSISRRSSINSAFFSKTFRDAHIADDSTRGSLSQRTPSHSLFFRR